MVPPIAIDDKLLDGADDENVSDDEVDDDEWNGGCGEVSMETSDGKEEVAVADANDDAADGDEVDGLESNEVKENVEKVGAACVAGVGEGGATSGGNVRGRGANEV